MLFLRNERSLEVKNGTLGTVERVAGQQLTVRLDGGERRVSVHSRDYDAIEHRYPMLSGTIRDHVTQRRRPFVRFYACEEDLSHDPPETRLPDAVVSGAEPFLVVGAMAGG